MNQKLEAHLETTLDNERKDTSALREELVITKDLLDLSQKSYLAECEENKKLRATVERYRKTLEWYANEANYNMETEDVFSTADIDSGHRARQVLKEKETPEAKCDCDDEWIFDEEEPIRGRIFEEEEQ